MPKPSSKHLWRQVQAYNAAEKATGKGSRLLNSNMPMNDPMNRSSKVYSYILELYFREMGKFNMLTEADFVELNNKIMNGERCRAEQTLVQHTLRYAISVAHHYCGRGVPFLDLIQAANCGLLTAARRFNPNKGKNYLTYADWWIRSEVFSLLRSQGRQVKIPQSPYDYLIKRTRERLINELGCEPSAEEVAACLTLPLHVVKRILYRLKTGQELHLTGTVSSQDGDDRMYQDVIASKSFLNPEQYVEAKEELEQSEISIRRFMSWVWENHGAETYIILCLKFGLDGTLQPKTLEKVGEKVGIGREGVRIHIVNFWKKVKGRQRAKTENWFSGRIEAFTILQDLLNEERKPIDLLSDAPVLGIKKMLKNYTFKEIRHRFN